MHCSFYKFSFFDFAAVQLGASLSWPISIMEFATIYAVNYVSSSTVPVLFMV
jgi:hypothetical protein